MEVIDTGALSPMGETGVGVQGLEADWKRLIDRIKREKNRDSTKGPNTFAAAFAFDISGLQLHN